MIDSSPLLDDFTIEKEIQEEKALGSKSPLLTLVSLIAGPLISQLTNAIYGLYNSFLVSKGEGADGLEVLSSLYIFDNIVFSFGLLSSISAASNIPYFLAQNRREDATKLIADLFKVVTLLGIFYPSVAIPMTKNVVVWLSGKEDVAEDSFKYMCISAGCSTVMFSFQLLCGILQGLGRTWLYGTMQITALFLDMFFLLPLFIFVFKWDVWCVALSQVLSQSVPALILFTMLLCGKLNFDLEARMFFSRISKETFIALRVGIASFILNLSEAFPMLALQKYIMLVAANVGVLDEVLTMYSIISRLYGLAICILIAFDSAFLPPASYAFGKMNYKRVLKLLFHTFWMTFGWGSVSAILLIFLSRNIFSLFSDDPNVVNIASELSPFCFATLPVYCIHSLVISFLQAIKNPGRATTISVVTTLIPMPAISTILYFTIGRDNLKWIFSTYLFDDFSTAIISLLFSASVFYRLYKAEEGIPFNESK